MSTAVSADRRWLYGPTPDLLFGCGLLYAVAFIALAVAGESIRTALPLGYAILPVNLIASAHYGATLLRVYSRTSDRRAYVFFALWATLLLGACFAVSVHSVAIGSLFITIYLSWSPWHYSGQNYGIALMFLRRRGVTVSPRAKRCLHLSFTLSFVLALLALHGIDPAAAYAPNALNAGDYRFMPLGIPGGVLNALMASTAVAYAAVTGAAIWMLSRGTRLRELAPTIWLISIQALWFSVPVLARQWGVLLGLGPFSIEHAAYAFLWIGAGHAIQYVWITSWYARESGASSGQALYLGRALLAGIAIWTIPALMFAPRALGRVPYDAGLAMLVAALVNLHHFVLDGAIWKLRDGPVARILLRPRDVDEAASDNAPSALAPLRPALWAMLLVVFGVSAFGAFTTQFGFNRALQRGSVEAAERAADRLEYIGQESAEMRLQLAWALLDRQDVRRAKRNFEHSNRIEPSAWAWVGLGDIESRAERWHTAARAYDHALAVDETHVVANFHGGVVALRRGQQERGRSLLQRAADLAQTDPDSGDELRSAIADVMAQAGFEAPPR